MIKCTVEENSMGHLTVTFENGKDIYLQGESDRGQFAVQHGLVKAPENWDGDPTKLPENWWDADFESITECLEDYERIAEKMITCTGCNKEVTENGYCEVDGSPYGDCCWSTHIETCQPCKEQQG